MMESPPASPSAEPGVTNNLLAALQPRDQAMLRALLRPCECEAGATLYHPGDFVEFAYFPCGPALASFKVVLTDGREVETALVGREGAVGGIVSRGRLPAYARSQVQHGGTFLRIAVADLEEAKRQSPSLHNLFARYADCLMAQIFQAVACNAVHTIEQRAAKWLLSAIDRTGEPELPLTQEQLAAMLGVGRSYVNRVMRELRGRGVLNTRRGVLRVCDMAGLQAASCGCDAALRRHFEEVLRGIYPAESEEMALQEAG